MGIARRKTRGTGFNIFQTGALERSNSAFIAFLLMRVNSYREKFAPSVKKKDAPHGTSSFL